MAIGSTFTKSFTIFARVFMLHILTSSNLYGFDKPRFKHRKTNDGIKLPNESLRAKLHLSRLLPNLPGFFLVASGSIILSWVGQLTWYDMTAWGKDIALIFFGSRTGENISLGIGMKVIYYFLIGLALLLSGLLTFLRTRIEAIKLHLSRRVVAPLLFYLHRVQPRKEEKDPSDCLHHFGYLASRPKNAPIPQECLICPRLGKCMVFSARHAFSYSSEKTSLLLG